MLKTILGLVIMLAATLNATPTWAGKVYKWTDEQGVVHYTDQKPQNGKLLKQIEINEPRYTPLPRPSIEEQTRELDKQDEIERVRAQQQEENKKVEALRQKRCDAARKNLEILNHTARVRVSDKDGKERFLTPEEIVERRQRYQDIVKAECQ